MKLRWTTPALRGIEAICDYVATTNPEAADRTIRAIFDQADRWAEFPTSGRAGRVEGTRELVITAAPYIVAYRLRGEAIELLAVLHTARRWPTTFPLPTST